MKFIFYLLFLYVFFSFSLSYAQSKVLDKSVITQFNSPIDISIEASDENGDKLTPSIVSNPTSGTLSKIDTNTNKVTYTPNKDFVGTNTFTYKVNGGTADSNNADVTITVNGPPNSPPKALSKYFSTSLNTSIEIPLEAPEENSVDNQLVISIVNEPQNGQLNEINQETGTVSYTILVLLKAGFSFTSS